MRTGGRCSSVWRIAGVAKTTRTPPAQPNRITAETPKTNASVTPLASRSSTGIGKWWATREATRKAKRATSVVVECGVAVNVIAAAPTSAKPAAMTGATTASRRGRIVRVSTLLPVEERVRVEPPVQQGERDYGSHDDQQDEMTAVPLQHRSASPGTSRLVTGRL